MTLDIVTVPCRSDNYAYLIKGNGPEDMAVVDAPEAGPIIAALDHHGWQPSVILLTHHHNDHTAATAELVGKYGAQTVGPRAEMSKMPPLDRPVAEGDTGGASDFIWEVIEVPGHTLGHIAFHFPRAKAVFTADSLMSLGCGRVFEGTPEMMWNSLQKLVALPAETNVYSGHEYTSANAAFAITEDPENADLQARIERIKRTLAAGKPTVPVTLAEELATNPFLRAHDSAQFAEVRARKDRF
ncbi:MAG: hydroxyacylglutathione hydrolase [Pseudomonadota bacterium]